MRSLKSIPGLLFAIAFTGNAGAATVIPTETTLVHYAVDAGDEFSPSTVADGIVAGMLGSGISLADLEAGVAVPGSVYLNPTQDSPTVADARANQQFFQFTLSTAGSDLFEPEVLTFLVGKGADTSRGWAIYSSLDGFTSALDSSSVAAVNPGFESASVALNGFGLAADPVTFRIYVNSPAAGQGLFFDDITVTGLVAAVPESSSFLLVALCFAAGAGRRRHH